jgi:CRP-like cAMP-binding protein
MNIVDKLAKMHIFRKVSEQNLDGFVKQCKPQSFMVGDAICSQGDKAENALILVSGKLEVSVSTESTVKHVGEIHPGEIFGEQGLFHSEGSRSATVIANRQSVCLVVTPKIMRQAVENPAVVALERHLIATMSRRIRATNLSIQKAWKDAQQEENQQNQEEPGTEEKPSSLLNRLRSLFGGRS